MPSAKQLNQLDFLKWRSTVSVTGNDRMTLKKVISGTNLEQAKSHNRRVVIEAIRSRIEKVPNAA